VVTCDDLSGLATQLLTEVFSSSFLTPLEDTDTCFQLEVSKHCCVSQWPKQFQLNAIFITITGWYLTHKTSRGCIYVGSLENSQSVVVKLLSFLFIFSLVATSICTSPILVYMYHLLCYNSFRYSAAKHL